MFQLSYVFNRFFDLGILQGEKMKNKLALFIAAALIAPSAFAAEITPYVGLGLVVDKAGTTAKRVKFDKGAINAMDPSTFGDAFTANAGSDMDFDMAYAGEITAGIKYGNVRGELEVAIRSASEDDYEIFKGNVVEMGPITVPAGIDTSTSVRHNSYMANLYYDFAISGSNWTPYIGAGVGFGTYRQHAVVDIDIDTASLAGMIPSEILEQIPSGEMTVADDTLTEFEWQVGLGATYSFTEDWALDIGYRFNSSTVADEFVYAHELKIGARYLF